MQKIFINSYVPLYIYMNKIVEEILMSNKLKELGITIDDKMLREIDSTLDEMFKTSDETLKLAAQMDYIEDNHVDEHLSWAASMHNVLKGKIEHVRKHFDLFMRICHKFLQPLDELEAILLNLKVAPKLEDGRAIGILCLREIRKFIKTRKNGREMLLLAQKCAFEASKDGIPLADDYLLGITELLTYYPIDDRTKPIFKIEGVKLLRLKDKIKEMAAAQSSDVDKVRILVAALELGYIERIPSQKQEVEDVFEFKLGSDTSLRNANKPSMKCRKTRSDLEDDKEPYTPLPIYISIRDELRRAVEGEGE